MVISKREFLQLLGVGVSALGMQPLLGRVAFAAADGLPAWAALPQGATPKTGGKLVYGQTYPNWAVGNSDNGKHPYFWIDLLTRSIWNSLAWVDHDYNVQGELAESWSPVDDTLKVWDFKLREGVQPQTYGLGVKELWEIKPEQHVKGRVIHTIGWPVDTKTYGGSWLYMFDENLVSVGYVVGLDQADPRRAALS